ncbi:MAG: DNA repair protein RadC [Bacteroidales bacterium]|nr:DNA repair protein RadC [Bacteroidales bacterium]
MKIKDLCEAERPREKLLGRGPEALADGELLAILLRTGRSGESALELAERLLDMVGGKLSGLFACDADYLASLPGVGAPKAAALLAAFELGRRFMQESDSPGEKIKHPRQIYKRMLPRLKGLKHEECWLILLDGKCTIRRIQKMTVGGAAVTIIDIPSILGKAVHSGAKYIILVHNHPSGSPTPSISDIRETASLREACTACSIKLLDHIIISDDHFYSFDEEKMF